MFKMSLAKVNQIQFIILEINYIIIVNKSMKITINSRIDIRDTISMIADPNGIVKERGVEISILDPLKLGSLGRFDGVLSKESLVLITNDI